MTALSPAAIRAIEDAALLRGDTRVLLTRTQLIVDEAISAMKGRTFVIDCSRRWGKTRFSAIRSHRAASRREGAIVRYCAPTKNHGRQFVQPAFDWLSSKLPAKSRPRFDRQASTWHWPNGSVCHLGSAETMADVEAQVGTDCDLAIADECGKIRSDLLKHWHRSVILPQFLTTNGVVLFPSTPPLSQGHYFAELVKSAKQRQTYARYTIDDCDHVSLESRRDVIREVIAPESIDWEPWMEDAHKSHPDIRRELYCEHISDPSRMIVPEWQSVEMDCVASVPVPQYADWFCIADFGFHDLTVVLWAWYDFANARLVVARELAMHRASGLDVGFRIREVEAEMGIRPDARFADGTTQLLADLSDKEHGPGIGFSLVPKDDAHAAINQLRMLIQRKRIVVDPSCKVLVSHLGNGTWNASRTGFDRVEGFGHWDALDALKYLSRVVDWDSNPTPRLSPNVRNDTHYIPPDLAYGEKSRRKQTIREAFR